MPDARYFLPDHPELKGEYSRDDLRLLVKGGKLSRSDMAVDDETGLAHLLGALLASPYYLSPHGGNQRASDDEEAKPPEEKAPASSALSDPVSEEEEMEETLDHDSMEPEVVEHQEFRAVTRLRQREGPVFEELEHSFEPPDEEEDDADDHDPYDDEEEDDLDQDHKSPAAFVPPPAPVFQAELAREEKLIFHGHPSWLSYPRSLLAFMALAGAAILCQRMHWGLEWCVTAAALALLSLAFVALSRLNTEYFITTRRVEVESGLIGRSTKEIRVADIRAIDVTQRGLYAILGVGTLEFFSAAGGESEVCFFDVYRPHRLKQMVRELQV